MKLGIRKFIPPIIFDLKNWISSSKYGWIGDESMTWEKAELLSGGYDSDEIISKVKSAILKVKKGEAIFERDSVLFNKIEYSWPLLSGILLAGSNENGEVNLVDFGGSLGSTYFQNQKFLTQLKSVKWSIIEQPKFVEIGKSQFQDNQLRFYENIDECIKENTPNTLLISSTIHYFEKPYEILDKLLKHKFEFILIDRTPFSYLNKDIVKLQFVDPIIYEASYPCWFLEENNFKKYLRSKGYSMIEEFDALDGKSKDYYFKGFIYRKIS